MAPIANSPTLLCRAKKKIQIFIPTRLISATPINATNLVMRTFN
jgi:hypothetical protein